MQNLQTLKVGYIIALFIITMLLPANAFATAQSADNWLDEPVTVRFLNEPLSTVLEKISKQTGIAVLYDQELANEKVSGNYKDVKASDAITRLFSGKNKSIQVSKEKKVIVVKTFGAKDFIWAGMSKGQDSSSQMTLAELEKLHSQQYKEYKERIADNNEVLEGDMTRGKVRAMQEKQYQEYKTRLANENEIIEGGEKPMTRGEVRAMQEKQHKAYKARIANENEVILEGGKNRKEIRIMQEQQYREYQSRILNDDEVVEGNMTRGQLHVMHKQQYNQYQERLKDQSRIVN